MTEYVDTENLLSFARQQVSLIKHSFQTRNTGTTAKINAKEKEIYEAFLLHLTKDGAWSHLHRQDAIRDYAAMIRSKVALDPVNIHCVLDGMTKERIESYLFSYIQSCLTIERKVLNDTTKKSSLGLKGAR